MAMVSFTKIQHPMQNYPYSPYTITHKLHSRQKTKIRSHETAARALFSTRTCQNPMINERKTLLSTTIFFPPNYYYYHYKLFFPITYCRFISSNRKKSSFFLSLFWVCFLERYVTRTVAGWCIIVLSRRRTANDELARKGSLSGTLI